MPQWLLDMIEKVVIEVVTDVLQKHGVVPPNTPLS